MDFPVEATVHLDVFPDEAKVGDVLESHGFEVLVLNGKQVRVKGSFLNLKAAKASLEQILHSKTQIGTTLHTSSPVQTPSSGAIPKHYTYNSLEFDGTRSRLGSRGEPLCVSPSPHKTSVPRMSDTSHDCSASLESRASFSPRADQRTSSRQGGESFVIDADVCRFAEKLRKKDIEIILENHNAKMKVREFEDTAIVTLQGRGAGKAASKLQSLMSNLSKSLRTQEVPRADICREGKALLSRIQKNNNIDKSVLVCDMNDRLHLIGPSGESYELKQKLLGRPVDQSQRTGRTTEKNSKRRSSSLPPANRRTAERDSGAITYPSLVGAAGYSPSKYSDDKKESVEPERGAGAGPGQSGGVRPRSRSESRDKKQAETANGIERGLENKRSAYKSKNIIRPQLLPASCTESIKNMKQRFKIKNKK